MRRRGKKIAEPTLSTLVSEIKGVYSIIFLDKTKL